MRLDFTGKRVLVTGSTKGIGRATLEAFLAAGAAVALNGSTAESTANAAAEMDLPDRLLQVPGSVDTVEGCRAIVAATVAGLGGLDILVNNAGVGGGGPLEKAREEDYDRVMNTNLKGVFFTTQAAVPHLRASKGAIVNIASTNGIVGVRYSSIYGATKAGVINMTKVHAMELAPDIRVNCVCPGAIDTPMLERLAIRMTGSVEAGYAMLAADSLQKRIAHPREVAGPVLYLASGLASFVTGSIHVVDGGETVD